MTPDEFMKKLDELLDGIRSSSNLLSLMSEYANYVAAAEIEKRVTEKQLNAKGEPFSAYSKKPMLTSGNTAKSKRVFSAMAGSKSKRRELKWVTIQKGGRNIHLFELPGGYFQLRQLEGYNNVNKSFEFTTQMWRKFGVVKKYQTETSFGVWLGGRDEQSQMKINANSEREGIPIIDMTKEEEEALRKFMLDKLRQLVKKYIP